MLTILSQKIEASFLCLIFCANRETTCSLAIIIRSVISVSRCSANQSILCSCRLILRIYMYINPKY